MNDGPITPAEPVQRSWRIRYERELNAEQERVVMHPGGPMLVLAGAGTGKTRTLVYRVCRLIESGVPAGRILLLTFTNKAAREMLDRVDGLLEAGAGRVMGGTFHSVGHRILRRHAERLGYPPRFSILDREDSTDLMGGAIADVQPERSARRFPKAKLLVNLYSFVINTGQSLDDVLLAQAPQFYDQQEPITEVFRRYMERKRAAGLMDFDDLLLNWLLLLKQHPEVRRQLVQQFEHVLVDEYQDTNRLQADIVDGMLSPQRNVMVVGDDAQSIYAFRGADFDNILTFPQRHDGAKVFRLTTNYRSTPSILALANASIAHNTRQFAKELHAIREDTELPVRAATPSPEAQAAFVADQILDQREAGIDLDEMAVLYRNHAHSLELQVELTRRNIPYRVRSGVRFFEQRHIKDVLAHLRFTDNGRDEVAFARMAKLRRGVGDRSAARLWSAIEGDDPLNRLLNLNLQLVELPRGARTSLAALQELLTAVTSQVMQSQPGEVIREIVRRFYQGWARDNLENAASRLEDLEQLALFADPYDDVAEFLGEITLLNELSGEDVAGGPVDEMLTLSTVHQAKGLEWRAVWILWLAEGRFPTFRAEDMEEERRLFYVAVTRAKEALYLTFPEIARDRYRVDVGRGAVAVSQRAAGRAYRAVDHRERHEEALDALPAPAGRYDLPDFLLPGDPSSRPPSDDDDGPVN